MCGAELTVILNDSKPNTSTIGYKCTNCKLQWTLAEHKDNQNWAVRHIRSLETLVSSQDEKIALLENQISIFAQLLQSALDLLNKHINA